jgi:SAM-dependent methyltransferase
MSYLTLFARRTSFHPQSVFEVGCSSGEALQEIGQLFSVGKAHLVGCEPNRETAAAAREQGLVVHETFFDRRMARTIGHFDLVLSRHVIEHVGDVVEFLSNLALTVRKPNGLIVIETPSLDAALANGDTKAFHVEHLHIFSIRSLALLGRQAGLTMVAGTTNAFGNLIVIFACHGTASDANATDTSTDLQSRHDVFCAWWKRRLSSRQIILWGAGSAARMFLAQTGIRPLAICDANPGKTGRRYVGLPYLIEYAPRLISRMIATGEHEQCVLVATSMFHQEIRRAAHDLGWRGDFVAIDDPLLGAGYGLR